MLDVAMLLIPFALSPQGVVVLDISQVSRDDRFAAIWFGVQLGVRLSPVEKLGLRPLNG